jgi:Phosphodiester glycosidase
MLVRLRLFLAWIGLVALVSSLLASPAFAAQGNDWIPPGFKLIRSENGVELYKKDYSGGNPDYVQVVNLRQGAKIVLLHGSISSQGAGKGMFGGDDPRILSQSLKSYWQELSSEYDRPFCVTNGQFFYMKESPTRLPFSLKVDGVIVSDGYDAKNFTDQKLMLELWNDYARIRPLTRQALYSSSAPNIVAGLDQSARKAIDHYVARTFIGLVDRNRDGRHEFVLIFNTLTARQKDAAQVLLEFGADQVMMLDGGGSTQLLCQGQDIIASDRLIPQVLGIVAAPESNLVAALDSHSETMEASQPQASQAEPTGEAPTGQPEQAASATSQASPAPSGFSGLAWVPVVMAPIGVILFLLIKSRSAGDSD